MRKYIVAAGIMMLSLVLFPGRAYLCFGAEKTESAGEERISVRAAEAEDAAAVCLLNLDALESHREAVREVLEAAAKKQEAFETAAKSGNTADTKAAAETTREKSTSSEKTDTKEEKADTKENTTEETPVLEMIGGYTIPVSLKARLVKLIGTTEKEGFHIGLVMIDIRTGRGIAYNAEQLFYSASTIKGPYMVSLTAIEPEKAKNEVKTMEAIARTSDNTAYSNLVRKYGTADYKQWCMEAGAEPAVTKAQYTDYSAEDLARLWLINYAYFSSDKEAAETAGAWFEDPNQSPIHKVLGRVYTTRTKAGWIGESLKASADAGIVYAGDSPYVTAILSDYGNSLPKLEEYVRLLEEIHADISGEESVLIETEKAEKAAKELAEKAKAEKEAAEQAQKEAEEQAGKAKADMEAAEQAQKEAEEKAEKAREEIRAAEKALREAEKAAEKARNEKEAAGQMQKEAEKQAEDAGTAIEAAEKTQKEAEEQAAALGAEAADKN